jgi:hypothetical protein
LVCFKQAKQLYHLLTQLTGPTISQPVGNCQHAFWRFYLTYYFARDIIADAIADTILLNMSLPHF